jgi:hypothetical protein
MVSDVALTPQGQHAHLADTVLSRCGSFSREEGVAPGCGEDLVGLMSPQALMDEVQYENTVERIDRLLGIHASMDSKILKGERSLTVEHLRKLADRFRVRPELFMA